MDDEIVTPTGFSHPIAAKTPLLWTPGDSDDDESEEEDIEAIKAEMVHLRAMVQNQHRKKRRGTYKAGSPQIRYTMRAFQERYNAQASQLKLHTKTSPGYEARIFLTDFLKKVMEQLDRESKQEGFDWRAANDRPHAKIIEFTVG